ncbi:MAG: hypothetical protein ACPG1C_03110 [Alphaproteobacteria bacterium]
MTNETCTPDAKPENHYDERVVGFADILGFAQLVEKADRNSQIRQRILEALSNAQNAGKNLKHADFKAHFLSDCFYFSAENSLEGFSAVSIALSVATSNMQNVGVYLRGGITVGNAHHSEDYIFGKAVNEAYWLESTIAKYPRVILGAKAVALWENFGSLPKPMGVFVDRDKDDGVHHLLPFGAQIDFALQLHDAMEDELSEDIKNAMNLPGRELQDQLGKCIDNPRVYQKLKWLANSWNATIVTSSKILGEKASLTTIDI